MESIVFYYIIQLSYMFAMKTKKKTFFMWDKENIS